MAALTAADLQKRHELEGAPDPFPSLSEPTGAVAKSASRSGEPLDTDSQSAFPSLGHAAAPQAAPKSAWGAGPRIKPVVKQYIATDSFTLTAIDLSSTAKDGGKPTTLGDVMKQVMTKFKVKIDASGNQKARQTTFHLKSESQKELEKAKRHLLASLSPVVTIVINAPASTIPSIIGVKGANLKHLRDQTNVKVDIPKREDIAVPNGTANGHGDEDEDEVTVPISITGPQPLALEAQEFLSQIIASKTSKSSQKVRDIAPHILPFVIARRSAYLAIAAESEIKLTLNSADREITVSGDRESVVRIVETIKADIENFKTTLTSFKISLPKRQHRLLVGKAIDNILATTKCAIITAKPEDPSDEVMVWGLGSDLSAGMTAVISQANSQYIHEFPLPGPIAWSKQLLTYMTKTQYNRTLSTSHPGVTVYIPNLAAAEKMQTITIELIGDKSAVDPAVSDVSMLIGKLLGGTKDVAIDWLVHRIITNKYAKKIKQFHDAQNVKVYFPAEAEESSSVLLVYDPFSPNASPSPDDKTKALDDVTKELLKLAKDAADVKSQVVSVEKRWHDAVVGTGGTTLNAIIGEDKFMSIKVGAEAGESSEDVIAVRGPTQDVDRVVKEILKIVESAKNDEIVNSYSTEFDIEREFVGRVVGSQGSGINRLRDLLGVKVDVSDDVDEKEKESSKKKKTSAHQKSKVKITGRQENVEEAKRRILAQIERLADETSEILKIPTQYHSSLIGSAGKYAIRLEEKYSVKITFPRQTSENGETKTREQLKADEVLIKGGKKGVAGAKSELLDAVDFEKESNNSVKFTVPTRAVARILGKGGASINEIKDATDAQIDVDKSSDDSAVANITVRGTKKGIAEAKASILAIAAQIAEEVNDSLTIEQKYHRSLIGAGGQGLKDLVSRCGFDYDSKSLAALIRFPRQGEPSDEVRLRGEPQVVKKVKAELEKAVATLKNRVSLGVEVPAPQHRALIGRGGQNLTELQTRTGAQIQFPGSRSYSQVGAIENADELSSVDPANLVKVTGSRAACEKAVEELKNSVKAPAAEAVTATLTVPLKYHHNISQQGTFFRNLRNIGVTVDHSAFPQKAATSPQPPSGDAATARIDEPEEDSGIQWYTVPNYQDAEEGDSTWTVKGKDQAGVDRAVKQIEDAIKQAERATSVGFLILPDRSSFPRIVGTRGSTVTRMRNETGADINVSRETPTIIISGSDDEINAAKELIMKVVNEGARR